MKKKTYVCKRLRLYNYLSDMGFTPYRTCKDKFNPKYAVWLYTWSDNLEAAVSEYYASLNDRIGKSNK